MVCRASGATLVPELKLKAALSSCREPEAAPSLPINVQARAAGIPCSFLSLVLEIQAICAKFSSGGDLQQGTFVCVLQAKGLQMFAFLCV